MLSEIRVNSNGSYEYVVSPGKQKEEIYAAHLLYENAKDVFVCNREGVYGVFLLPKYKKLVQVWIKRSSEDVIRHYCEELPHEYNDKLNLAIALLNNL